MNLPADMLPMYTASMSSERSFASWIAFNPASIPRSRKERSHSSPNSVSPTPITATSRKRSGLPHQDLTAVLRVRRIVDERMVRDHLLDGRGRVPADLRDFVRDGEVECVRPCATAVPHREDAVARLRLVQNRAEAHHDQEGGAPRRGAVLEGIAGGALARVRSDREAVLHHLRQGEAHRRLDCGGPGLARELEVRGGQHGRRTDRLRDDRRGRLHGVRVGFRADVDRADLRGIDVDLRHTRPRRFDGDRDHVLVGAGYALRPDVQPAAHRLAVGPPDHADVLRSNPVPRDVSAITDDACLHPIRSNLEMRSACSSSVRARRMLPISASFIASSSMFSGCTYTTMAGLRGFALIAIIGDRPYLTPVKSKARSLVDPSIRR